jgi:hypothetical protein
VQLEGNAEEMEVAVYSASLGLLAKATTGAQANGWARVALPAGLANGTYFYRVQARRGSVRSVAVKGTLVLAN